MHGFLGKVSLRQFMYWRIGNSVYFMWRLSKNVMFNYFNWHLGKMISKRNQDIMDKEQVSKLWWYNPSMSAISPMFISTLPRRFFSFLFFVSFWKGTQLGSKGRRDFDRQDSPRQAKEKKVGLSDPTMESGRKMYPFLHYYF